MDYMSLVFKGGKKKGILGIFLKDEGMIPVMNLQQSCLYLKGCAIFHYILKYVVDIL